MRYEPTDEELIAFADSLLAGLRDVLRDPEHVRDSVTRHRELWLMLYGVNRGLAAGESPSTRPQG